MPSELLQKTKDAQLLFRDVTDFSPATATDLRSGTPTAYQLDVTSVANDAARQSDKFDLGATRAPYYYVRAALEFAATPTAGNLVEVYIAWSNSGTAGNGNPAAITGADAAYTGYSSNLDASLQQLDFIGTMIVTAQATATVQVANVGGFAPKGRYGSLVFVNRSGAAMHSDAVESHIVFDALVDEAQ